MNKQEAESVSKDMLEIDSYVYIDDYNNHVIRVWIRSDDLDTRQFIVNRKANPKTNGEFVVTAVSLDDGGADIDFEIVFKGNLFEMIDFFRGEKSCE